VSVYFITARTAGKAKIGFATDAASRFAKMKVDSPLPLTLERVIDGDIETEQALHARFGTSRTHGEWFDITPELDAFMASQPEYVRPVRRFLGRDISDSCGISKSYASEILNGIRRPPLGLAVRIYREVGWRHPRITDLTEDELALLERIEAKTA